MPYCLLTNDVETTSIWFNTLRDDTGRKVLNQGMPVLLDIYAKYGIKSTFYFTGYIAGLFPEMVRMVLKEGHEVGSHGKSHLPENGFDVMPYEKQKRHLEYTKKLLEDISGQEVLSFRAPALRVGPYTARALLDTGHKIDSSIASQRFDFFLSFGSLNKLKWIAAPRKPYVGTTMRILPGITAFQRWGFHWESCFFGKPVVFDIHPNEFIDESDEKRIVHKRSSNPFTYFLKDVLRSKLKIKNLGLKAVPLYEREISFYKAKGYKFTTVKDYCQSKGLL